MTYNEHSAAQHKFALQFTAKNPLRIGTRQSPLAIAQTHMVRAALLKHYKMDENNIILVPMMASGDKITDRPLADIGGKALWTKELERALIEGQIDLAVHSMKDVETIRPDHYTVAAMLPRADVKDSLIGATSIKALKQGAKIGTSSPRRKAQLLSLRPDLICNSIRGNVATRLSKIENKEFDATLLASAGLSRLGMNDIGYNIDIDVMMPAASQGAIGVECLTSQIEMCHFLGAINHYDTMICVKSERSFLAALTGDCHSPIAAHAQYNEGQIILRGQILSSDGSEHHSGTISCTADDYIEKAAHLADSLLESASPQLRASFQA